MSEIKAWTNLLANGQLQVTLCNAAELKEDSCPTIVSLRSSHPSYFSLRVATLPDCILMPGEARTMTLDMLPECSNLFRSNSEMSDRSNMHVGLGPMNLSSVENSAISFVSDSLFAYDVDRCPRELQAFSNHHNAAESNFSSHVTRGNPESVGTSTNGGGIHNTRNYHVGERLPGRVQHTLKFAEFLPIIPRGSVKSDNISGIKESPPTCGLQERACPLSPSSSSTFEESNGNRYDENRGKGSVISGSNSSINREHLGLEGNGMSNAHRGHNNNNNNNSNNNISGNGSSFKLSPVVVQLPPSTRQQQQQQESNELNETVHDLKCSVSSLHLGDHSERSSSGTQTPYFFVYYAQLGRGSSCLKAGRKWLKTEQQRYIQWRRKTLEDVLKRGGDESIMPPLLGGPVRWLKNMDVTMPHVSQALFYRKPYSHSSAKMFEKSNQNNGCVMLPCRPRHVENPSLHDRSDVGSIGNDGISNGMDGVKNTNSLSFSINDNTNNNSNSNSISGSRSTNNKSCADDMMQPPIVLPLDTYSSFHGNNRSSAGASISSTPGDNVIIAALRSDKYPPRTQAAEREKGGNSPEKILRSPPCGNYHPTFYARTETDETVCMLEHTVCGDKSPRDEGKDYRGGDAYTRTDDNYNNNNNNNNVTAEWAGSRILGGAMGSFWSRPADVDDKSTDGRRRGKSSSRSSSSTPQRLTQTLKPREPHNFIADDDDDVNQMMKRHGRNVFPHNGEMRIAHVSEAIRTIAENSAPVVQTAVGGTISVVATSAQQLYALIEDYIEILHVVCIPVLVLCSLYLLWIAWELGGANDVDLFD